jgi:hypothetical protein
MFDFHFSGRFAAIALSAGVLLWACDGTHADSRPTVDAGAESNMDEPGRWVGEVADSDVRVGIVADSSRARLFFCGGADSYATATRWFALDIVDGAVQFADDSWHVRAGMEPTRVSGTVERDDGVERAFSAELIAPETLAGLYEGQAACGRLGLIVVQSSRSSPVRAQGACVGPGHAPEQVNPILPIAQDMGAISVEAPGEENVTARLPALQLPPL